MYFKKDMIMDTYEAVRKNQPKAKKLEDFEINFIQTTKWCFKWHIVLCVFIFILELRWIQKQSKNQKYYFIHLILFFWKKNA